MTAVPTQPTNNPIDDHIGQRVRALRESKGLESAACAAMAQMSEDRLRLCESGRERLAARELIQLARCLDVQISAFFAGLDEVLS